MSTLTAAAVAIPPDRTPPASWSFTLCSNQLDPSTAVSHQVIGDTAASDSTRHTPTACGV